MHAHLDTSVLFERTELDRLVTAKIVREGRLGLRISPFALSELVSLVVNREEAQESLNRVLHYINKGYIQVHHIRWEDVQNFLQYINSLAPLAGWLGPTDIFIIAVAAADHQCRYLITLDGSMLRSADYITTLREDFYIVEPPDLLGRTKPKKRR